MFYVVASSKMVAHFCRLQKGGQCMWLCHCQDRSPMGVCNVSCKVSCCGMGMSARWPLERGSKKMKCDGITSHPKEETYGSDPSHSEIEPLSYHLGNLQDPRTFPYCSRVASSRYSVPAGPSRGAQHFLLLVSNMGWFPELTPVHRQTTEVWLPTLGASDRLHPA